MLGRELQKIRKLEDHVAASISELRTHIDFCKLSVCGCPCARTLMLAGLWMSFLKRRPLSLRSGMCVTGSLRGVKFCAGWTGPFVLLVLASAKVCERLLL